MGPTKPTKPTTSQKCLSESTTTGHREPETIAERNKKLEKQARLRSFPFHQNDGHGMVGMRIRGYMSFADQEKKHKRQPIRSKRKIGRNEPCPCGRYKMVEDSSSPQYTFTNDHSGDEGYHPVQNPLIQRRLKYKNCCGHPDNQRATFMAKRHIISFARDLYNRPAKKEGLISKFKNLFGRKK